METGARDKHSNLPPLTWGQQTLVSDKMLNPQEKVLTSLGPVGKTSLGWGVEIGLFCTQAQGETGELKYLSLPYQTISGAWKGDCKN